MSVGVLYEFTHMSFIICDDIQYCVISVSKTDATEWNYVSFWPTQKAALFVAEEMNDSPHYDTHHFVSALRPSERCFTVSDGSLPQPV